MKIDVNHMVQLSCELRDLPEGVEAEFDGPVNYVHGSDAIPAGLEKALLGREKGESFEVRLQAAEAYGEYNPDGIIPVPRDELPDDLEPDGWRWP